MEEKRRIRLRWRRLVCYLLILLAAASCYIVLRSYLLLHTGGTSFFGKTGYTGGDTGT